MMKNAIGRNMVIAIVLAALPYAAIAQSDPVDPQAEKLLKAATTFLAAQQRFTVETRSTLDAVLTNGQKIKFDFAVTMAVERPDRFRAQRVGDLIEQIFYYDGSKLTLYNPDDGYFATTAAPATIEEALDYARESLDLVAPGQDLLYKNAFAILTDDVVSALVVGKDVVGGVRCDHLAFRNPDLDWQIWIEEGDRPLPRRMVITSIAVEGAPEYAVELTKYDLEPDFGRGFFRFNPPEDATEIAFLTASGEFPAE